jgi:hypothetical protein
MKAMGFKHLFKAKLNWFSNKTKKVQPLNSTVKNHTIAFEGKPVLNVSAAKAFKGDQLVQPDVIEQCCFLPHDVVFICL